MESLENVQRLFFQHDLLVRRQICGQRCSGHILDARDLIRQRFRQQVRSGRTFQTVWKELGELGIVRRMKITARNQENLVASGRIRQFADIR